MTPEQFERLVQAIMDIPELSNPEFSTVPVWLLPDTVWLLPDARPYPITMDVFWQFLAQGWVYADEDRRFIVSEIAWKHILFADMATMLSQLANCCECEQLAKLNDRYLCKDCS